MIVLFWPHASRGAGSSIRRGLLAGNGRQAAHRYAVSSHLALYVCAALLLGAVPPPAARADAPQHVLVRIAARTVLAPADGRVVLRHADTVQIDWLCDEAVELHVHGYDLLVKFAAAQPLSTTFTARATGRFPVTVHAFGADGAPAAHHRALLYIEVQPR